MGFTVSGVVGAVQTAESMKLQQKLQEEAILAQEKQMEKQHEHEREMMKAQQALYEMQQQQNKENGSGTDSGDGGQSGSCDDGLMGTYDENGNFHLSDGSGYIDKEGNFHLADGSGYYDKDMNFYYSDGTGYLDKDGNFHLSDGSGYYDKDGNYYPTNKDGHYDKDGNYIEKDGESDYEDDDNQDKIVLEKNTDVSRKSTYSAYYEDISDSDNEEKLYEASTSKARSLSNQDYFESYITDGVFTHRELQSIKENIASGRMNFFTIEYMYEEDMFTLDQANAALDMLKYFQTSGSF